MRPIRVLQFITPSGFYGAERWVLAFANNSDHERVINDLAVTQEGSNQDLRIADLYPPAAGAVHYISASGRFDLRILGKLLRIIRDRNIDIIHTHGYKSDILGFIAARISGIKCISTPHGFSGNVGLKLKLFIGLGARFFRYFDAVAPLSEELLADMRRFSVKEERLRLILNGVDLREIGAMSSAPVKECGDEANVQRIGFVGQLIPRKGVDHLIDVFDALYQLDSRLRLRIVGDGRQREELEALAASKKSSGAITFLGFRDDRLAMLAQCDLFVMTSSLEGIPRCMMEAMALGVPVAAYDIPGVKELVIDGETGLLAPLGDKDALIKCCSRILYDPEKSISLSNAARDRIDGLYSAKRMATEYEDLYCNILCLPSEVRSSYNEDGQQGQSEGRYKQ